jgi:uncharacterized membrane protein (GlpM family)
VSRQPELPSADGRVRGRSTAGEAIRAVIVPCILYICLQFAGLVLHILAAAHNGPEHLRRTDVFDTVASVCSIVAWLVLLVGLVRLVVKLRASAAARAQRRRARYGT